MVSNIGTGPVDAAVKAVQQMIAGYTKVKIRDFRIEAITGGADALAEVTISVEDEEGRTVTAHAANTDIVTASVDALVNGINILLDKKKLWNME